MTKKKLIFLVIFEIFYFSSSMFAQFNTIKDTRKQMYEVIQRPVVVLDSVEYEVNTVNTDSIINEINNRVINSVKKSSKSHKYSVRKYSLDYDYHYGVFPDLTLNNLRREIRRNGILYEDVVIAQAILETGWFTSSVCKNYKNLFGLTNPRTGDYYKFDRWQDSVKAYYTKVQYKYKGGNYLLWLDRLPYATRTTYVTSLLTLLRQYFL